MAAAHTVTYPAATGDKGGPASLVRNGNLSATADTDLPTVVGAGLSGHFTAPFDLVMNWGSGPTHVHFNAGQTYVLSPQVKAVLLAASAPMTVV